MRMARSGSFTCVSGIETLNVSRGRLPSRAVKLIREWASQHEEELLANWQLMVAEEPLSKIDPLP